MKKILYIHFNLVKPRSNVECLVTKHFIVWPTLFDAVWSCLVKFEIRQTSDQTPQNITLQ